MPKRRTLLEARLEARRRRIEQDLKYSAESMRRWHGANWGALERRLSEFEADVGEHERTVRRAIRAGMVDHPIVAKWLEGRRTLGEWDWLRRFRLGLERGVRKPMSPEDFWVSYHASELAEQRKKPESIRRALCRKLALGSPPEDWFGLGPTAIARLRERLNRMPRQNFNRLLLRLGIEWPT